MEQSWVILNITLNARNYVIEKRTRNHIYSYHSEFCGNMKLWQYYPLSFVGQLREQSFWDTYTCSDFHKISNRSVRVKYTITSWTNISNIIKSNDFHVSMYLWSRSYAIKIDKENAYIYSWSTPMFHYGKFPLVWVSMHLYPKRKKRQIRISKRFHVALQLDKSLTLDFAESQVKKRVKKGGSLPSMMIYIGASWDNFSIRKSRSRNFCQKQTKKKWY